MSESHSKKSHSRIKELINKGKEQGYLTYAEVNDHLPDDISDPDQVEDIIQMINDMGIHVYEAAPDAESILLADGDSPIDETAAAEAAAALVAVENEAGRTTDPVRMYMREMGTVELLTREGEILLAKRIEEGIRGMMAAMAYFPGSVAHVLNEYSLVEQEERRLPDIISGYLDPTDDLPPGGNPAATAPVVEASNDDSTDDNDEDDKDEKESGPDPEEAKIRFGELKKQYQKTE